MPEPLLRLNLRLATASSAATVAANDSSTRNSVLAAVTSRASASDTDTSVSTPTFTAYEETLKKLPAITSISVAASDAISDANAERVLPEPISTVCPTLMSTFLPAVSKVSSAVSTNIVVVSRATSWTADISSVLFSITVMSVDDTPIADMTTARAMSELMSTSPPECTPILLAATDSTIDAVRLSASPTLVDECRPVLVTASVDSSCISSAAENCALPTDDNSMFGVDTLSRSVE